MSAGGISNRRPRARVAFVFVIDRSGSMAGAPWATVCRLVTQTVARVPRARDDVLFLLAFFNQEVAFVEASSAAEVEGALVSSRPSGGTLLFGAMEATLQRLESLVHVPHLRLEVLTDDETSDDDLRVETLERYTRYFHSRASDIREGSTQVVVRRWGRAPSPLAGVEAQLRNDRSVRRAIRQERLQFRSAAPDTRVVRLRRLESELSGAGVGGSPTSRRAPARPELRDATGVRVERSRMRVTENAEARTPPLSLALPEGLRPETIVLEPESASALAEVTFAANRLRKIPVKRAARYELVVRPAARPRPGVLRKGRARLRVRLRLQGQRCRDAVVALDIDLLVPSLLSGLFRSRA